MEEIELYYLPGCPYCQKVEDKLEDLDVDYVKNEVPSSHSKRDKVEELSDQTAVPVINDENNDVEGMNESSDIVEYLEEEYGGEQ